MNKNNKIKGATGTLPSCVLHLESLFLGSGDVSVGRGAPAFGFSEPNS